MSNIKIDNIKVNIGGTWRIVHKIRHENTHQLNQCSLKEIISDGNKVNDQFIIASKFNDLFVNIIPDLTYKIASPSLPISVTTF